MVNINLPDDTAYQGLDDAQNQVEALNLLRETRTQN